MRYVDYGNTGLRVSRFGLGCMRFPADEREAVEMVRYAVDNGVNYLDSAYIYGNSEVVTGKAMRDGYRQKVVMATKSPLWNVNRYEDFEKYLDEELLRLGTDYVDVYLLHNLYPEHWEKVKKYDGLRFLNRMVEKGKIRHKGFSIHSTAEAFVEIANSFDWDMAQIQLNILDGENQAGIAGLRHGAERGIAMVIMEPLRGGSIITNAPPEVTELVRAFPVKRSLADWCFRWLYNFAEASVILSGTHTLEQLKENIAIFDNAESGVMSADELELVAKIKKIFLDKKTIGCTACDYCAPCPQGVKISEVFKLYNDYKLMATPIDLIMYQRTLMDAGTGADKCADCGECAAICPQSLDIPALLKTAHAELSKPFTPPKTETS